jgi:hypothetical protein
MTRTYLRANPCTSCGQPVTVALMDWGGHPPIKALRHSARPYAGDRVDDECNFQLVLS